MYLYLVKTKEYHKIGITQEFRSRLSQLQTASPFKIEPVYLFEFDDAVLVERVLHQKFQAKRASGEWFSLNGGDIEDIKIICEKLNGRCVRVSENEMKRISTHYALSYMAFTFLFMSGLLALVMYGVTK